MSILDSLYEKAEFEQAFSDAELKEFDRFLVKNRRDSSVWTNDNIGKMLKVVSSVGSQ